VTMTEEPLEMHSRYQPLYSSDFPFPLAEPSPEPVMVTRPCGCTSMVIEPEDPDAKPVQISWCVQHDPGYESGETSR
jgi:hypothetical protein